MQVWVIYSYVLKNILSKRKKITIIRFNYKCLNVKRRNVKRRMLKTIKSKCN